MKALSQLTRSDFRGALATNRELILDLNRTFRRPVAAKEGSDTSCPVSHFCALSERNSVRVSASPESTGARTTALRSARVAAETEGSVRVPV